jgi:RimJ/RimL family protein N-acetyltransferase
MDIECYGIRLVRLTASHIELVRQWRNRPDIVAQMEYQTHITAEMQQRWFARIDNVNHHYFLIEQKGQFGGLIHTAPVNWERKEADTGLFLAETNWIDTPIPAVASLAMVEVFFEAFRLARLTAKVHSQNERALRYNSSLGFVPVGQGENSAFVILELTPERFFQITAKARSAAARLYGSEKRLILKNSPLADFPIPKGLNSQLVR